MPPLTPMLPDTIVAISTPPGRGGIGVVRLSGPGAVQIASGLVRLRGGGSLADAAHHAHARLAGVLSADAHGDDPASEIDEALVTVFHAPRSYTGEALVEIAAHGSPVVLEAIVRNALAAGASTVEAGSPAAQLAASLAAGLAVRLAAPGEFTQRAFLAGRLDLTQAEAVHDLIAAQTLAQARTAASQLGGALSRRVAPAKEALLQLIALLEAGMDFASGELDDVDIVPATQIAAAIGATHVPLAALAATFRQGQLQRGGAAVALAGPPNAGKSSLFNRLLQRERAIVTPVPGTTRDTVEETLALGGIPLRLVDTAGLREGNLYREGTLYIDGDIGGQIVEPIDEAERLGIVRSREALADADLVLLVHDATLPRSPEELTLAAELAGRPHVIVYNKADLLEAGPPVSERAGETQPVYTSAMTGQGLDELRDAMLRALNAEGASADAGLLNNLRQQQAVTETLAQLDAADAANAAGLPHELLLLDLHAALESLDTLTGTTTTEDILTRIFSTFCIGK